MAVEMPENDPTEVASPVRTVVEAIVTRLAGTAGPLLPVLHAVQDELGCVPPEAVPVIAEGLNLSRAEVHGVVSFYHWFRSEPRGRRVVRLCRAEACQARGQRALEAHVKTRLGIDYHQTTPDGAVTLEPVYCLGNCASAPSLLIDDDLHEIGRASCGKECTSWCRSRWSPYQ